MREIEYVNLDQVNPEDFLPVLNEEKLRLHLVAHGYFDSVSIREWMRGKLQLESLSGCRVRAVYVDGMLAGWCGIQPDDNGFELAIVIAQKFWGVGIPIFKTLMCWAQEFGHSEVMFHLLETRPEYMFLKRMATKVQKSERLRRTFTTYWISVPEWSKQSNS